MTLKPLLIIFPLQIYDFVPLVRNLPLPFQRTFKLFKVRLKCFSQSLAIVWFRFTTKIGVLVKSYMWQNILGFGVHL